MRSRQDELEELLALNCFCNRQKLGLTPLSIALVGYRFFRVLEIRVKRGL